jgi:hypothetical protein
MPSEWHYTQNGQPAEAPVNDLQLKQLAVSGQLKPEDLVWKEGMPSWAPARSIRGLFDGTKPASSDPPSNPPSASTKISKIGKPSERPKTEIPEPAPEPVPPAPKPIPPAAGLHPFLVFLLTVLTLGLFGLLYALGVGRSYAGHDRRTFDLAGRPLGRVRHPVLVLLLGYLTFGYYLCWWISQVMQECAGYTERRDIQPRTELNLMLICPFYSVYLAVHRLPELVRQTRTRAGLPETGSWAGPAGLFLTPCLIVGYPILCMIHQDALNQVWLKEG